MSCIVPSPIDCQLRKQKINFPTKKKQQRDAICQTDLQLPIKLPKEIEDLLLPYFSYATVNQQQSPAKVADDCDSRRSSAAYACGEPIDHEARNASLSRKLFGSEPAANFNSSDHNEINYSFSALSPPPTSPILVRIYFYFFQA